MPERVRAAVKGMLVAVVPTCLAAGASGTPLTVAHLAFLAASVVAAGGVAFLPFSPKKEAFLNDL